VPSSTAHGGPQAKGSQKGSKNDARVEEDGVTAKEEGGPSQSEFFRKKTHQQAQDCGDNPARLFPEKKGVMGVPSFKAVSGLPCTYANRRAL